MAFCFGRLYFMIPAAADARRCLSGLDSIDGSYRTVLPAAACASASTRFSRLGRSNTNTSARPRATIRFASDSARDTYLAAPRLHSRHPLPYRGKPLTAECAITGVTAVSSRLSSSVFTPLARRSVSTRVPAASCPIRPTIDVSHPKNDRIAATLAAVPPATRRMPRSVRVKSSTTYPPHIAVRLMFDRVSRLATFQPVLFAY